MSNYLDFTTTKDRKFMAISLGNPIHDGELPTPFREVRGVRVDDCPVEFSDDSIPDRIHQALIDGKYLRPREAFKCVAFVALMHGLKLRGSTHTFNDDSFAITREEVQVGPHDRLRFPLDLAAEDPATSLPSYEHMIYPAHTPEQPLYVHKLGSGPVCLSGLEDALRISRSTMAHPITSLELK